MRRAKSWLKLSIGKAIPPDRNQKNTMSKLNIKIEVDGDYDAYRADAEELEALCAFINEEEEDYASILATETRSGSLFLKNRELERAAY